MFQGCCHLQIEFSKLHDLNVRENGPKSRDYTIPDSFPPPGTSGYGPPLVPGFPPPYGPPRGPPSYPHPHQPPQSLYDVKGMPPPSSVSGGSPVLLVNNLTPGQIDCDKLFTLFGVYGDVIRVKILYTKRDTAMIQFANAQQAQTAQLHLNRLFLHSKEIGVNTSKHTEVALPPKDSDPELAALTKDYSGSPVHRFGRREARTMKNINPPSQVLHLSNLYDGCTEDDLKKIFTTDQTGCTVQFFPMNRKMAFVKLDSVHEAVLALIRTHNLKFGDKYMRVSFSLKDPNQFQTDSQSLDGHT